MLDVILGRSS